ncbi:hypothetical protein E4T39_08248 [Aureobasidium subglaciale]|nr:hypothetical protein E4T39_08248 [Aureobasidium subglaciale]
MSGSHNHISGCYHATNGYNRTYLPQVQLDTHTTITPLYFTTKLSQTFQNPSAGQLSKVRYTFPLYDGVVVTAFTCVIGNKIIKGHIEQKDQARKTFHAAVKKGESAGLLEPLPLGIFGVTLGNIPAETSIRVDIVYGGELKHDAEVDGLRYMLPTSIAPRYGDYPGQLLPLDSAVVKSTRIVVDVDMEDCAIRKVQCPSNHPIALDIGTLSTTPKPTADMSKASVSLSHNTTELGSDFVLQIVIDDIDSPRGIIEAHSLPDRQALMVTFVPRFNLKPIRPEIIFIADQSGSMQGTKNTALVAALKTFIKSLPSGVRFNICAFGSHHKFLWEKSMPYNQENYTQALQFVQGFTASYGGTELLRPVKAAFESHLSDMPLELVVLTDGEIYAESQLFDHVNDQIHKKEVDARCFVLGVGRDVSHTLVEGFARAGNGVAQFITDGEVMDFKVVRMLKAALYPHIKDYRVELKYDEIDDFEMVETEAPKQAAVVPENQPEAPISLFDKSADLDDAPTDNVDRYAHLPSIAVPELIQAPHTIPPLLPFNRTTVYLLMQSIKQMPKSVVLHGTCSEGPLTLEIPVKRIDDPNNTINTLSARKAAQELEEGRGWLISANESDELLKDKYPSRFDELIEKEVVRIGTEYQVANKWCSFVAVQQNQIGKSASETLNKLPAKITPGDLNGSDMYGSDDIFAEKSDDDTGFDFPALQASMMRAMPGLASAYVSRCAMPSRSATLGEEADSGMFRARRTNRHHDGGPSHAKRKSGYSVRGGSHGGPSGGELTQAASILPAQSDMSVMYPNIQPSPLAFDYRSQLSEAAALSIPDNDILAAVRALLDLQTFDGHWEWTPALATFFRQILTTVKVTRSTEDSIFATVLVLAWLKSSAGEFRDLWDLVAEKGSVWLCGQEDSEQLMRATMDALAGGTF